MGLQGIEGKDLPFFRNLLRDSNSPMAITDATTADNPIVFVNRAFEDLTGYSAQEALGQNCRFLQGEDRHQVSRQILTDAIKQGVPCECLIRNYRKSGEAFWNQVYLFPIADNQGLITNFVGIQHDVSSQRQLLASLQEKQSIVEGSPDVYLKVCADSTILEANAACSEVFGWAPEELVGKSVTCLLPEGQRSETQSTIDTLLQQPCPQKYSGDYLRKGSEEVFIEWTITQSAEKNALLAIGRDATQSRKAEREAIRANAQVTSILDSITEGCLSIDREWRCTYINTKGADWLFRRVEDLVGKNIWDEFPDAVGGDFYEAYHLAVQTQQFTQCEAFYTPVGKWLEARAYPSSDGLTVFFGDISERKKNEHALLHAATHDSLTGLRNRSSCIKLLTGLLSSEPWERLPLAVLFIDLDHFKEVNDAFGHRAGDRVLEQIGQRLHSFASEHSIPARISGDEFVFILSDLSEAAAKDIATKILESIALPIETAGSVVTIGASIGIAFAGTDETSADELINHADMAMYVAKAKGRYSISVFTPDVAAFSSQRLRLRQEMLHALRSNQFVLHYQPQVTLMENKVIGAEALIRWQHPELGLLSPAAFLDIAEESPLIIELGAWVFAEACRQLAYWQSLGNSLKISVNVSMRQLADLKLPELMERTVKAYGIHPQWLKLEVTESMLAQDLNITSDVLQGLKQRGFGIALDDFGTGYSNLSYIRRFPVSSIKIDRSFVTGIDTDEGALVLINAVVALAKSFGLRVVCEGVETPEQRTALESTQCDIIQGYLVSRPLPADAFYESFLNQNAEIL